MQFFLQKVSLDEPRLKEGKTRGSLGATIFEVLARSSICIAPISTRFY